MQAQTRNILFDLEKEIRHLVSAVKVISSNPCVGPIPRIKISFLLSIYADKLTSTPNIMTFLTTLPSGNENSGRESNPVP